MHQSCRLLLTNLFNNDVERNEVSFIICCGVFLSFEEENGIEARPKVVPTLGMKRFPTAAR